MQKRSLLTLCCLLGLSLGSAPCSGEEFLLYAPKPVSGDQLPTAPNQGVLVKRIIVKRGDTLKKLSRMHTGVASWFPQLLLFNTIKNPDLIQTGDQLLVPVRAGQAAAGQGSQKVEKRHASRRSSLRPKRAAGPLTQETQVVKPGEMESYQRAQQAYLDHDYQKALDRFSSFLRKFPRSRFAADASLYRADCYLRLSGD